jgi:hypothetical protein
MSGMIRIVNLPIVFLSLLFLYTGNIRAQDRPEFKMSCPEVLKLGLNKFVNAYGEKTGDYSTYGQKQAFSYYVDCRRPGNDKLASQLSDARSSQVDIVRSELSKLGNASWSNAYLVAGGGTLYGLASVGAYAEREDFMTAFIKELRLVRPQRAARRSANVSLARVGRSLAGMSRMPDLAEWDEESRPRHAELYRSNINSIKDAVTVLTRLIRLLPDNAAEQVARQMDSELAAGIEE